MTYTDRLLAAEASAVVAVNELLPYLSKMLQVQQGLSQQDSMSVVASVMLNYGTLVIGQRQGLDRAEIRAMFGEVLTLISDRTGSTLCDFGPRGPA